MREPVSALSTQLCHSLLKRGSRGKIVGVATPEGIFKFKYLGHRKYKIKGIQQTVTCFDELGEVSK